MFTDVIYISGVASVNDSLYKGIHEIKLKENDLVVINNKTYSYNELERRREKITSEQEAGRKKSNKFFDDLTLVRKFFFVLFIVMMALGLRFCARVLIFSCLDGTCTPHCDCCVCCEDDDDSDNEIILPTELDYSTVRSESDV